MIRIQFATRLGAQHQRPAGGAGHQREKKESPFPTPFLFLPALSVGQATEESRSQDSSCQSLGGKTKAECSTEGKRGPRPTLELSTSAPLAVPYTNSRVLRWA